MSVPLSILLLPLAIFLLLFFILSLVNIAHLMRFASFNMAGFWACFIFMAGSALFLYFAWGAIDQIDWKQPAQFGFDKWNSIPGM